jgi:hypothetical protein
MWLLLILALGFQQPFLIMHDPPISSISCFRNFTLRVWAAHTSVQISVWAASCSTAQCDICFLVAQSTRSLERIWQSYHLRLVHRLSFPSQGNLGSNFKDLEWNSDTFVTEESYTCLQATHISLACMSKRHFRMSYTNGHPMWSTEFGIKFPEICYDSEHPQWLSFLLLLLIYLLTAIGLSPGGSTHLHTNNT